MVVVSSYVVAVFLDFVTMLCWGSWASTQKMTSKEWRSELFYWDYVFGVVLLSLLSALTLGSFGEEGRGFFSDLEQAEVGPLLDAFWGGAIFNVANILLLSAIVIAGMSVAIPIAIGIAIVIGVWVNYTAVPTGNPTFLLVGVVFIICAVAHITVAYRKHTPTKKTSLLGLGLSISAGIIMSFFYRMVIRAIEVDFDEPTAGLLTPYTAVAIFSGGVLASNLICNPILMWWPFEGEPVSRKDYFKGSWTDHAWGILGGIIWGTGMLLSIIAANAAGPAISYALSQCAIVVATLWGYYVWGDFEGATATVRNLIYRMVFLFFAGLGTIVLAG